MLKLELEVFELAPERRLWLDSELELPLELELEEGSQGPSELEPSLMSLGWVVPAQ